MDYKRIFLKEAAPTSIGGQAIMEGVMMRGEDKTAVVMRLSQDNIYLKVTPNKEPSALAKVPFVRGIVSFCKSLVSGMKVIMDSADVLVEYGEAEEEYEEPSKLEKKINERFGEKAVWNIMMAISVFFAVIVSVLAFIVFPTLAASLLGNVTQNTIALNLAEAVLRLLLFLGYLVLISKMNDIKRLFQYHGAEHKTIHCFENGEPLTPKNAQKFYRLHPRCGTSFIMFVFIVSLVLFAFLGWPTPLMRILSRIVLLPVVAAISYELLRTAGRSDNALIRILSYPGLWLQKLTTNEPTDEQLEIAIISLQAVLSDNKRLPYEVIIDREGHIINNIMGTDLSDRPHEEIAAIKAEKEAKRLAAEEKRQKKAREKERAKLNPTAGDTVEIASLLEEQLGSARSVEALMREFDPSDVPEPEHAAESAAASAVVPAAGFESTPQSVSAAGQAAMSGLKAAAESVQAPGFETGSKSASAAASRITDARMAEYESKRNPAELWPEIKSPRFDTDKSTVKNTLKWGQDCLSMIENGKNDASEIFCYVTGFGRTDLVTRSGEIMKAGYIEEYERLIEKRLSGVPLQYITKVQVFMGLPFRVNENVLIPRLDTEVVVEQAARFLAMKNLAEPCILDLCTGSGAIGVTLAHRFKTAEVTMADVSPEAIGTAMDNARLNGVYDRCLFVTGDLLDALPEKKFDLIVSNPPYIKSAEIRTLDREVRDHEPMLALDGGKDGLDFYRRIIQGVGKHLGREAILVFEIGSDQGFAVSTMLKKTEQYSSVAVIKDLAELDRVVIAVKK